MTLIQFKKQHTLQLASAVRCLGTRRFQDKQGQRIPFVVIKNKLLSFNDLMLFDRTALFKSYMGVFVRRICDQDFLEGITLKERANCADTHVLVSALEGINSVRVRQSFINPCV